MKLIILAGGWWSRLWPLSQGNTPKQFIALDGEMTMLEKTIERLLPLVQDPRDIIISTSEQLEEQVKAYVCKFGIEHVVAEPAKRNTAPAFWFVLSYLQSIGIAKDEACLFFPADHEITPTELFHQYIHVAIDACKQQQIILFGIKPTSPEVWFGYIKVVEGSFGSMVNQIEQFVEKPDLEKAIIYMQSWKYFWNAGIFCASFQTFWNAFLDHVPEISSYMIQWFEIMKDQYTHLTDISIDYAIMEKVSSSKLIPMSLNRSDMGSRDAVYDYFPKNLEGNVLQGNRDYFDVKNSLLYNMTDMPCKATNLDNMIFVITEKGCYTTKRWSSQDIKKVL
jgi:mannose-1-phosphate guanylyltransferase/mannose-6-phosphate isomerase